MDPNNPFGFDHNAPDAPSSGNSPNYAPSSYIQQEQSQHPQQQETSASTHTDPNNPLDLGFGNGGGGGTAPNNAFSRLMNRHLAEEAQHAQQGTIMSSHADLNPADTLDNDPSEIERIRNRYARHEKKLKIMEALAERESMPGGTVGRRGEGYRRGGVFDFGYEEEDDHIGGNIDEDYGNGAWEVREVREFNRVSPPLQDDDEYGRRGHLRHEDDEDSEESEEVSDDEHRRRVLQALRQIREGRGVMTGFKQLQRGILRRSQRARGLGFGQPERGGRGFRPASSYPSLSQPQSQPQGLGFGPPQTQFASPPLSQPGGLGFDPLNATPLELLGMGGGGHLSNMVADSLPGGDGVTRTKRPGFPRQTETYYREFKGGGRQHPTQQERGNAKTDFDSQSDLPDSTIMHDGPRHTAAANTHPDAAGGRGNLLDCASASLGLNPTAGSLSMGPVLNYAGPPLPPGSANQPPNTNMGHPGRPFQPFGASQPANPMLNPFLNPQPLPSGIRPVGANLPEGSRIGLDGKPYAPGRGAPRPVPVSAFPLMGTNARPIRWNRVGGMASDDDDDEYESYDENEIDEDAVDGIPHHLAFGHGRGRNGGNHRHFNTAFSPPSTPINGNQLAAESSTRCRFARWKGCWIRWPPVDAELSNVSFTTWELPLYGSE